MPVPQPRSYAGLLRERRFLPFFLSQTIGDAGYAVYAVSVPWLAYRIGGAWALGLALFVEFAVYALSFAAGPVIDRVADLRPVLVAGFGGQAVLAAVLGFLALDGGLTVATLLVVVVPLSVLWDFTWTAANAAPRRLVGGTDLLRVNGLLGAVSGGNQIAGYAAGASLLLLVGPIGGMFLYAAMNLVAGLCAAAVRAPRPPGEVPPFGRSFREGWTYFVGGVGRPRLQISTASAVQAFVSSAPVLLLTAAAAASVADPSRTYAVDFAALALGGIAGSLLLGTYAPRHRLGPLLAGLAVLEAPLLVVAVRTGGLLSFPAWGVLGVVDVGFYTVMLTYFQSTAPPALVGRTVANAYLFRGLARAAGALVLAGVLTEIGIASLAWAVAAAFVVAGGVTLALPGARRMAI